MSKQTVQKLVQKLILSILGLLLGLLLLEGLVRVFGLAPHIVPLRVSHENGEFETIENPILKYVPRIGTPGINALGFHDREFSILKSTNTYRILVLGDSIAYGYCETKPIEREKVASSILEKYLNDNSADKNRRFEVINGSVSGYNTAQEVEFFRVKGVELTPDLVIIFYCLNDDIDQSRELVLLRANPLWDTMEREWAILDSFIVKSDLVRLIRYRFSLISPAEKPLQFTQQEDAATGRLVHEAFERLSKLVRFNRTQVLVTIVPVLEDFTVYTQQWEHERTSAFSKEFGFLYLDLLPAFKNKFSSNWRGALCMEGDPIHPNEQGHRLIGETLGASILEWLEAERRT